MTHIATPVRRIVFAVFSFCWLAACASPPQVDQAPADLPLALEKFFDGPSEGDGVFVNSWSGAERRFRVRIDGSWDGKTLTLVEDFDYADGEKDRKTWKLTRTAAGRFSGTREDVVGEAQAWTEGGVVRLQYKVLLGGWTLGFSDVLATRADGSLINRAIVDKWGIRVGRVELLLRKPAT